MFGWNFFFYRTFFFCLVLLYFLNIRLSLRRRLKCLRGQKRKKNKQKEFKHTNTLIYWKKLLSLKSNRVDLATDFRSCTSCIHRYSLLCRENLDFSCFLVTCTALSYRIFLPVKLDEFRVLPHVSVKTVLLYHNR